LLAGARLGELESQNAALLLQLSSLRSDSFLVVAKSGASYDLFCAS